MLVLAEATSERWSLFTQETLPSIFAHAFALQSVHVELKDLYVR
jgi:hypothetical protein